MAGNLSAPSLDGLLDEDNHDVEALERLEARILEMVEQLREARRKQLSAEKETVRLKDELAEKERTIEKLQAQRDDGQQGRKVVRSRIESLLDRIESLEQS